MELKGLRGLRSDGPAVPLVPEFPQFREFPMKLVERMLTGDRRALARLITLIENNGQSAWEALAAIYPHTGRAYIIGVTGAPGTGKSTLVNELTREYRSRGRTVGIVAVDPTSPFTGGALLGDRVRMQELSGDEGVFIRSMATRGGLGGLARATADVVKALDAFGKDIIFVETVGAGQAEVDIARHAHTTIVVIAPGLGDDVQAIKAGIMEIADIFAVNKADREGADSAAMTLEMMLNLGDSLSRHNSPTDERVWRPLIIKTVAVRGEGIVPLVDALEDHTTYLRNTDRWRQRERERVRAELRSILSQQLTERFLEGISEDRLEALVEQVLARTLDPYSAVASLLQSGLGPG